jgi:hypothetical protein
MGWRASLRTVREALDSHGSYHPAQPFTAKRLLPRAAASRTHATRQLPFRTRVCCGAHLVTEGASSLNSGEKLFFGSGEFHLSRSSILLDGLSGLFGAPQGRSEEIASALSGFAAHGVAARFPEPIVNRY